MWKSITCDTFANRAWIYLLRTGKKFHEVSPFDLTLRFCGPAGDPVVRFFRLFNFCLFVLKWVGVLFFFNLLPVENLALAGR